MNRRKSLKLLSTIPLVSLIRPDYSIFEEAKILKRLIPGSNVSIPVVGLGTWQTFDVGNNQKERTVRRQVLSKLVELGGSVVDSSPMYGSSEQVVGDLATSLKINEKLFMATKVWVSGRDAGIRQMKSSIKKMQKPVIDLMQIHNLVDWKTHIKTLQQWKEEGKVRFIGITHYVESAYDRMEQIMKNYPVDFIQLNYSILSRTAERSILPLAKEKGIAVLINQPYESGSLFRKVRDQELPEWTKEFGCKSWGQFFLKYILSNDAVTCVIPGTSKPHHLVDNLGAAFGRMPSEEERRKMVQLLS